MSKESEIMREHIRTHKTVLSMCNEPEDIVLNRLLDDFDRKDQRIAELEEQLKNAIMPKFKIGQKVLAIVWEDFIGEKYNYRIIEGIIDHLFINRDNKISYGTMCQSFRSENLFATEEEAKLKLEELESKYDKLHKTNKL